MKTISLILTLLFPLVSLADGKITNADIYSAAAIAMTKLAAKTANNVCTFDGSGFIGTGVAPGTSGNILTSNGSVWTSAASTAALSIGALDAQAATATGQALVSNVLSAQSADSTHPGLVNNTTQTLSGAKSFSSTPTFSTMTAGSVLFAGTAGILEQDNSNFFYDSTGHNLSIGSATTDGRLAITNTGDTLDGNLVLWGQGRGVNSKWDLYDSPAGTVTLYNPNQANYGWSCDITGRCSFGAYALSAANAVLGIKSNTGYTTNANLSLVLIASQTGDYIDFYASDGTTKNAYVTVAGKGFYTGLDAGSQLINNVSNPSSAQDAATKSYVDTQLAQLNPAAAVVAASTANIAGTYTNAVSGVCIGDTFQVTSTAAFAPDGVTLTTGQRFLMKDQSSTFQNGVWTLTTAANVGVLGALLTRALDFDSSDSINAGQIIPVSGGTVNAGASWYQTAVNTTCNSSTQTWTQFQKASSAYASSTLTNTHIFVGNGSNVATDVAVSGDATLANTGAVTVAKVNGVAYGTSPGTSTVPVVTSSNTITYETVPVAAGGTSLATLTTHALYAGNGTSAPTALAVGATNTILHGNTGADPSYSAIVNADITNSTIDLTTKVTGVLPSANVGGGRTINAQTGTTYTFALGDGSAAGAFPLVTSSNASAQTVTVPTNASVAFAVGTQIDVCQIGAGKMTIAAAGGVTINSLSGNKAAAGQYVCLTLVKTATDTWILIGNLIAWTFNFLGVYAA